MLRSCNIGDVSHFAPGWLGRYVEWASGGNNFPLSFHLLSGLFALSTVMGRKAQVPFHGDTLRLPQSVLLLGPSAVGKSQTLYRAGRLIRDAVHEPWNNALGMYNLRPGFVYSEQGFTPRGLMNSWSRTQAQQEVDYLEGAHIETEMAKIVTQRKGAENMNTWIISVLEHRDLEDFTGMYGHVRIPNISLAFGFASTMAYLRKALDVDEFSGGLMHRFLIAHETEPRGLVAPQQGDYEALVEELRQLHASAPEVLGASKHALSHLGRLERVRRTFSTHQLSGFWGRFSMLTGKIAGAMAIASGSGEISKDHVLLASDLLRNHLAPVLEGIVEQLAAPPDQKLMFDLQESLESTGPKGWAAKQLIRKSGKTSQRGQEELLTNMVDMGFAFRGKNGRFYARKSWVPEFRTGELDEIEPVSEHLPESQYLQQLAE